MHQQQTRVTKRLTAKLDVVNPFTNEKQRGTIEDEVVLALITKARNGDVAAIREILDTMYGKVKDQHEHAGAADYEPVRVIILPDNGRDNPENFK